MLEGCNIQAGNAKVIIGFSRFLETPAVHATGLILLDSAGVLCFVLCLCIGNSPGRVAHAQQTQN